MSVSQTPTVRTNLDIYGFISFNKIYIYLGVQHDIHIR